MLTASFTGLVRIILLIIGSMVALRFIGRLMIAKRNLEEERQIVEREKSFQKERNEKMKTFGKTSISKSTPNGAVQDVEFEEMR